MKEVLSLEIMSGTKELANIKRCPNGHSVSDGMRYCPVCGEEIVANGMRYCPNCGKERHSTDKFCAHCGFSFVSQVVQQVQEEKDDSFSFFGFLWFD